jgi:hypothetical protein
MTGEFAVDVSSVIPGIVGESVYRSVWVPPVTVKVSDLATLIALVIIVTPLS